MDRPRLPRRPVSIAAQQALTDHAAERPTNEAGRATKNSRLTKAIKERAALTGLLPHEILLTLARGEPINQRILNPETGEVRVLPHYPDMDLMVSAAKAAAPYFAPKLSAVQATVGLSDADLDELIGGLATEAGISVGARREGEEGEGEEGEG